MTNRLLLYVTKMSIDKFQKDFGDMEEIHLYKILFLVEQELLKSGINLGFPYRWYLKGPMLVTSGFASQTGLPFEKISPDMYNKQVFPKYLTGNDIAVKEPKDKDIVDNAIDLVFSGINRNLSIADYLISEAYKYAPSLFQRDFKKFETSIRNGDYTTARKSFEKLVVEFPETRYSNMRDLFLEWEMVVDLGFEMQKYSAIEDINTPFWRAFCHKLTQTENKNLTDDQLKIIKESSEREYLVEKKNVFELSSKFYRELNKSDFPDQSIEDADLLNQLVISGLTNK